VTAKYIATKLLRSDQNIKHVIGPDNSAAQNASTDNILEHSTGLALLPMPLSYAVFQL